ncbi:hypothetical protein H6761_02565 [Candidatus Nomurabacteria bacterium]|nr:hypothetical protein [Candidatus Nomurabacteria bacterium]
MDKSKEKYEDQELENLPEEGSDFGEILATWQIPEFSKTEKSKKWYIYFILILIALLVYSYFDKNPLFAIILVFFSLIYWLNEKRDPEKLDFAITEDGLIIGKKFIEYKNFKDFYLIYQPPKIKNLYFQPRNTFKPLVTIPLLDQNPVEIRKILLEFMTEDLEKEEIPGLESIGEIFKL